MSAGNGLLKGTAETPRGFTQHEHLNSIALIHMNGRAYDYNLGRFLSVDPIIQFPANSQSLNPYSYLMNNPMSGTDPSGYMSCSAAVQGRISGGCTGGEDPSDPDSAWGQGVSVVSVNSRTARNQSNGANQTANSASASTQVPEIHSPSEAGKTNDASAETNPYGPYPPFSVTRNLESYAVAGTEPDHRMVSPELGFLISLGISAFSGTDGFSGENAPGDDSIEGGFFSPAGLLKFAATSAAGPIVLRGASSANSIVKSIDDMLKPGGELIGVVQKGSTPNIRTVSQKTFGELKEGLLSGASRGPKYAGGKGVWYELPNGGRVGVRTSEKSGETLDFNLPGFPRDLKVHQQ